MVAFRQPKRFSLGKVVATPGALEAIREAGQEPSAFLDRHVINDWGEVDSSDQEQNDQALVDGCRILSAYSTRTGTRLWIITEADRSSNCFLLPSEY
jgi:hypothetical protein